MKSKITAYLIKALAIIAFINPLFYGLAFSVSIYRWIFYGYDVDILNLTLIITIFSTLTIALLLMLLVSISRFVIAKSLLFFVGEVVFVIFLYRIDRLFLTFNLIFMILYAVLFIFNCRLLILKNNRYKID